LAPGGLGAFLDGPSPGALRRHPAADWRRRRRRVAGPTPSPLEVAYHYASFLDAARRSSFAGAAIGGG